MTTYIIDQQRDGRWRCDVHRDGKLVGGYADKSIAEVFRFKEQHRRARAK